VNICIFTFLDSVALFLCVLENGWGVQAFYIHGDDDSAAVGYRLLNHYADGEGPDEFTEADSTIRSVSVYSNCLVCNCLLLSVTVCVTTSHSFLLQTIETVLQSLYGVGVGVAPSGACVGVAMEWVWVSLPAKRPLPFSLSFALTHSLTRFPHTRTRTLGFHTHAQSHTQTTTTNSSMAEFRLGGAVQMHMLFLQRDSRSWMK